jgi:hypothetical protein
MPVGGSGVEDGGEPLADEFLDLSVTHSVRESRLHPTHGFRP